MTRETGQKTNGSHDDMENVASVDKDGKIPVGLLSVEPTRGLCDCVCTTKETLRCC